MLEDDFGLRTTEQWDLDASMIGGFTSLSTAIRKFIATTTIAETDEFGNTVVDPELPEDQQETLVQAVDYVSAYNGLLKAVKNTTSPMKMLQKMYWFGEGNPETAAVVNRIFTEIGVTAEDIESGQLPEIKNPLFFQSIIKGFQQFRIDYIFVHTDTKGKVHLYSAANKDDTHSQLEIWSQAYDQKREHWENKPKEKEKLNRFFRKFSKKFADEEGSGGRKSMSNPELDKTSQDLSNELYNAIGVRLSPTYIAYSIARGFETRTAKQSGLVAANEDINPILWEDIYEMGAVIERGEHLFLNVDGEGASTRLTKLAVANGLLDENVGATVFLNPEGNFVYAHQMPTYHLEKVAELNNEDALKEMQEGDVFLNKNQLLNDERFLTLARNGKLRVLRVSGNKLGDIEIDDETGSFTENNFLDVQKKPGTTYGDSTPRQFIIDLIELYTLNYNRKSEKADLTEFKNDKGQIDFFATSPHLIRVIEASNTGDFVPLPVIKAVEYNSDGEMTPSAEAVDIAVNNLINEFRRIRRETFEESGYTEDRYKGYNDSKNGRAFTLWDTGKLVTKRESRLEDRTLVKSPTFGKSNDTEKRILEGEQKAIIRTAVSRRAIGLRVGESGYVVIGKGEEAKEFQIKNKGLRSINEINQDEIYEQLGDAVRSEGSKKDKRWRHEVKIGDRSLWTDTAIVADFLNGKTSRFIYELVPKDEVVEEVLVEKEESVAPTEEVTLETAVTLLTKNFTRKSVEEDSEYLYLFTDNAGRTSGSGSVDNDSYYANEYGKGKKYPRSSQAVIRGLENAYPITTMVDHRKTQWTDDRFDEYKEIIDKEVAMILAVRDNFKGIKVRNKTIGEGQYSDMKEKAPKIWAYLNEKLNELHIDNTGAKPKVIKVEDQIVSPEVETEVTTYEIDASIKTDLERLAQSINPANEENPQPYTFEEAVEAIGMTMEEIRELVSERMMFEVKEFELALGNIRAMSKLSKTVMEGKFSDKEKSSDNATKAREAYNLREGDPDFNLAQIFLNDWLNTKAFNQILLGDQAMTLKDAVDQIKRAKMQNAAGPSAASIIAAPEYGIEHPNQHISMLMFDDPTFKQKYGVFFEKQEPGKEADGQMYMTTKAFKYIWFGLGKYSVKHAELMKKIERGETISAEEFFGPIDNKAKGYKQSNAILNAKKLVYGDGKIYGKMSVTVLTKEFTSREDKDGNWVALEQRKELHDLRDKMEAYQDETDENGKLVRETIVMASPASSLKMLKRNLTTAADAYSDGAIKSENITDLDPNYLRLQQINPSNKVEITDPTQIKNLITSEQDDSVVVTIGDKEMTIGEVRKAYHHSVKERITLNYIGRRNLTFDLPTAMDELHDSIELGEITPDLRSFLRYAVINLQASKSRTQMVEFFSLDLTGEPKYDLNNPITIQKFQELFLSYFSKGVLNERIPGHSLSLFSGKGVKIWKKVISIDKETGQPERWEIIRTDQWVAMSDNQRNAILNAKGTKLDWDNKEDRTFSGLKEGDHYIDGLRANVKNFDENGKDLGTVRSEFIMPAHFREVMEKVIVTKGKSYKSKTDIFSEWFQWVNNPNYSPEAKKDIVRADIPNFNPSRSRKEFAAAFNYRYNPITDDFEDSGNKIDQKIPEVIAKLFGVRIPSQDKHSAVNLELVDFMPVFYGSTAVFPEDLIEISGADFDIDKLYAQIKEFYNIGRDFHEYGKGKTEDEKYADYIRYTVAQASKKGNVINDALSAWNEKLPGNLGDEKGVISNYLNKKEIEERLGPEPAKSDENYLYYIHDYNALVLHSMLQFSIESDETVLKLWEKKNMTDLMGAMETLHLPITKKQYIDWKNKRKYKIGDKEYFPEPYIGALNNEILDYKYALLGNKGMTEPQDGRRQAIAYEPADLVPLYDEQSEMGVWNFIEENIPELAEIAREDGVDIDNLFGKLRAWSNNKEGARSIGAAVLPNLAMNILQENNVEIRSRIINKVESIPQIRLNNWTYRNFNTKYQVDTVKSNAEGKQVEDVGGFRTQYVISAMITAMTDNAKERLAFKIGLNKDALGIVTNLTALGVDIRTSVLLVNQPSIRSAYFDAINKEKPKDPGVKKLLNDRLEAIEAVLISEEEDIYEVPVTTENLAKNANNVKMEFETADDLRLEYSAIKQFLNARRIKEYTGKMLSLVKLHKGFGRDMEAIDNTDQSIEELGIELTDSKFDEYRDKDGLGIPIDIRGVFNEKMGATTFQARIYTIYKEFTQQLLPSAFLTRTPDFMKIKDVVLANMTKNDRFMTSSRKVQIEKDILSYISIKAYMRALSAQGNAVLKNSLQNGYIYDQLVGDHLKLNEVINRVKKYLEHNGKTNFFLDKYVYQDKSSNETNNSGINKLRSNTWTRMSDSQVVNLQNSFLELYSDLNTREDAIHIVHYVLVKDAMQYKAGTILDAIPAPMFDNLLQQVKSVHNAFNLKTKTEESFRRVLGESLPELYNDFVDGYLRSINNGWLIPEIRINSSNIYDPRSAMGVMIKNYGPKIREVARDNEDQLYVFADNASEIGKSGHQLLRGIDNALNIHYKLGLGIQKNDYYDDNKYTENVEIIDQSIKNVIDYLEKNNADTVFPSYFLGTTESDSEAEAKRLKKFMPKTFTYLQDRIKQEFGYDIKTGATEKQRASTKALSKQIYINSETKKLIIDEYKGLVAHVDEKTGARKMSRSSGTKTKEGKKIPAWKVAMSKMRQLTERNIPYLAKSGLERITEVVNGRGVISFKFPYILRANVGTMHLPKWKFYKLDYVWSSTEPKEDDFSRMISDNENTAIGNRAEYSEIELDGAYAQNPDGFLFGPRPSNNEVKESIKEKDKVDPYYEDEPENLGKTLAGAEEQARERVFAGADKVTAKGNSIEVEKNGKVAGAGDMNMIKEIQEEMNAEAQDIEIDDSTVETTEDQDADVSVPEGLEEEAQGRGQPLSEGLKALLKSKEEPNSKITEWWNSLDVTERGKVRAALKIETLAGLVDEFNIASNLFTEEEFINDIIKCHL